MPCNHRAPVNVISPPLKRCNRRKDFFFLFSFFSGGGGRQVRARPAHLTSNNKQRLQPRARFSSSAGSQSKSESTTSNNERSLAAPRCFFFLRRMQEPLLAMHLNPAARFPAIRFYASLVFRCLINTAVLTSSLLSFSPVAFFPYSSHCHRLFRFILFYLLSSVIFPSLHPFHDSHFSFLNPPFLFFPPYFSNHFFLPSPFLTFSKSLPLNFVSFPFLNFFFHSFLHPSFVHLYSLSLSLSLYTFFTSPFPYRSSFILIFIMS